MNIRPLLLTVSLVMTTLPSACLQQHSCCSNKATTLAGENDPRRTTPDAALAALKAGNERFRAGFQVGHRDAMSKVAASAAHQYPIASVIGCADSRTAPEAIFDLGIGELFVCRVAGVAAEVNDVASLEYGSEHLGVPLIVVLGHTHCGAMAAAVADKPLPGSLPHLIDTIRPSVERARAALPDADKEALIAAATKEQVLREVRRLKASPVLSELIHEGKLRIVGAIYDIQNGTVSWL